MNASRPSPPRWLHAALKKLLADSLVGRSILGDLQEEYQRRLSAEGAFAARAWYRREAAGVLLRGLAGRLSDRGYWRDSQGPPGGVRKQGDGRMKQCMEEFKLAVRSLLRSPGFALAAVLTLSLGIGANAAVFSVVNGVLLDPLPFQDPDRLVIIQSSAPGVNAPPEFGVAPEFCFHYRNDAEALEDAGLYDNIGATLRVGDRAERLRMAQVTLSLFSTLGVSPALGRLPSAEEVKQGVDPILISHALWTRQFGNDPEVLGRTVEAADRPRVIVGVMGPEFTFPEDETQVWLPYVIDPDQLQPGNFSRSMVGRVKEGVEPPELLAQLVPIANRMPEIYSSAPRYVDFLTRGRYRPVVHPLKEFLVGDLRRPLWILLATVLVVWMIACANVANLFFVRAEGRQHEMAVRSALGAGRVRLIRVFSAEALLLSLGGGIAGSLLAWGAVPALLASAPPNTPRLNNVHLDAAVLAFTAAVTVASALLFGLVPALRYSSAGILRQLHCSGRKTTAGRQRQWGRAALVVAQSAMAMVLLVSSGLLLESFRQLAGVDPGYDPEDVLTFQIAPPNEAYPTPTSLAAFHRSFMEKISGLPGVESVGAIRNLPIDEGVAGRFWLLEGAVTPAGQERPLIYYNFASPDYFRSMGIEVLSGRAFQERDEHDEIGQAIVSRSMAETFWPGQDPLGKRLSFGNDGADWQTVVGVVEDVRDAGLREEPKAMIYLPFMGPKGDDDWAIRSPAYTVKASQASSLAPLIRDQIRSMDTVMPLYRMQTMEEVVSRSIVRLSFTMMALGISALMALALGTIGLYGVLSYVVTRRTNEIGIRLALGARLGQVRQMVVMQGTSMALAGIILGLVAAGALTSLLHDLLYGTQPWDPLIFSLTTAVMLLVSLLACFIPAHRACRVDPAQSLRLE
ncbi:MAG TPA: ABC transporter permease [Acidobacteriota bacterium]|nr:ABC transporter permease [Acidobacteriota bacterium]